MNYQAKYRQWLESPYLKEKDQRELEAIADNEEEIQDRFYKELEFGTGGMRGKIAMGSNRMNIYTVGKSTQGLADFLKEEVTDAAEKGVIIAYDPRYKSREFSERAARVLAANGIKVYLFDDIRPTPELSFAVKEQGAAAGIMITASHNPPEYNGYKVYGENAAQLLPEVADKVIESINRIQDYTDVKLISLAEAKEKGLLQIIGKEVDQHYYQKVKQLSISQDIDKNIKIVYTPLHGTGNIPVRTILKDLNYTNVFVDEEQARPDPEFSTVDSPNPEDSKAFERAVKLGKKVHADILIATDPDCDRVAVSILQSGSYLFLNGNQTGVLLLDYLLRLRKEKGGLPQNGFIVKTIVTSDMGSVIAGDYGISTFETLTGFKFICNKAMELEEKGATFLFGYEESIGYLTGDFVRDKDAVISSMLIVEMAAYYKKQGITLVDRLNRLYEKHGYFLENLESIYLEGIEGEEQMNRIMADFRQGFPEVTGMKISRKIDYQTSFGYNYRTKREEIVELPQSDVLKCFFSDGSWYAIRPSGTEPKIKTYLSLVGKDQAEAEEKLKKVKKVIFNKIDRILKKSLS